MRKLLRTTKVIVGRAVQESASYIDSLQTLHRGSLDDRAMREFGLNFPSGVTSARVNTKDGSEHTLSWKGSIPKPARIRMKPFPCGGETLNEKGKQVLVCETEYAPFVISDNVTSVTCFDEDGTAIDYVEITSGKGCKCKP